MSLIHVVQAMVHFALYSGESVEIYVFHKCCCSSLQKPPLPISLDQLVDTQPVPSGTSVTAAGLGEKSLWAALGKSGFQGPNVGSPGFHLLSPHGETWVRTVGGGEWKWWNAAYAPSRILQSFVLLLKLGCEPPLLQKNQRLVSPSQILI